jgi:putative transposase
VLNSGRNQFLSCQRYIELNPVRANMVEHPFNDRGSSYRVNAEGIDGIGLVNPHKRFHRLEENRTERLEVYRDLFKYEIEVSLIDEIRKATNVI